MPVIPLVGIMRQCITLTTRRSLWALVLAAVLHAPGALAAPDDDIGDAANGKKIATAWCSNCHAFPGSTHATATGAPSFTAIAANRAITPMSLRAFLQTPHGRMPDLHLTNTEMDDLIAFILAPRSK